MIKLGKKIKKNRSKLKISRTHKPDDLNLEEWQRILRKQYGEQQNYKLKNTGRHPVFSEFLLTNPESGKTYKIAIRGNNPLDNYCSCPDYSINSIGTCKHIEFTLSRLKKMKGAKNTFKKVYKPPYSEVYLSYGMKREIKFKAGKNAPAELLSSVNEFFDVLNKMPSHAAYGYDEVKRAIEMGAIKKLLVSDKVDVNVTEELANAVETVGAEWMIISVDSREGEQLHSLSGIAAILRFPMS